MLIEKKKKKKKNEENDAKIREDYKIMIVEEL